MDDLETRVKLILVVWSSWS